PSVPKASLGADLYSDAGSEAQRVMPFKAVAIGIGAGISVLAVTGVLFLDRGGGTDDSGEPRFLRFVASQPSLDLNRFVRAEVGARARKLGYRLTVERVTLKPI